MVNDIDVNAEMLKAGLAWHYKKYDDNGSYAELEAMARKNKIGLWSDKNPIPPRLESIKHQPMQNKIFLNTRL